MKLKINFKYYLERLLALLKVRQVVGGVDVSDVSLRLVYSDGSNWHFGGIRLTPGVVEEGKIKDYGKFVAALRALKFQVFGARAAKRRISVIVSLSSVNIYSQVFGLPAIEGENLERAIELNVQMISPMDTSQAYSGWQMVGRDSGALRLEVLSAFIDKTVIDTMNRAFGDAGFLATVVESRALALARLAREEATGIDMGKAYVLFGLDNSGMDFMILRGGQLYFEYFNSWRDLADEKGEISSSAFEMAITRNLHRVLNFYGQHWSEPLSGVILSATALKDEVSRIIGDNFSMKVDELKLRTIELTPEWFVALGCGLRGIKPRGLDEEISLLGVSAKEEFHREQFATFAEFWRLLLPATLVILLAAFFISDLFLAQTRQYLESQSLLGSSAEQSAESNKLVSQAEDFNNSVAIIGAVQAGLFPKSRVLEKIYGLAASSQVSLTHFTLQPTGVGMPILIDLDGSAASENLIISFKNVLAADPTFADINLPLTGIKTGSAGFTFSLSFSIKR